MKKNQAVILKEEREKPVKNRHHWIFSGAIKSFPEDFEEGSILPVLSNQGELLGHAYFNRKCSLIGRIVSFGKTPPLKEIEENIRKAIKFREYLTRKETNAYRLINGEGDFLPGLIVDRYGEVLVIQVTTLGMEKLKPFILDKLVKAVKPVCVYEKSLSPSREEEGLSEFEGILYGEKIDRIKILEAGISFFVEFENSQKTGFFLDQSEMRSLVRLFSSGKKVLDCFSYTGGFSVSALKGGATRVDAVDSSERALSLARENVVLNGIDVSSFNPYPEDAFKFLRECDTFYDFIILDPPAFARKKKDIISAARAYKDINRIAIERVSPGGLLMTFSCSYYIEESLFRKVVFQAAREAGRRARIIQKHRLSFSHPINIFHPESEYLKGLFLYLD